ncbi:tryptophan transporter [Radiobacillus kanasensis]|uniref:tryptophan transporter n=1 Tax=Radiobacillus kanasensis TaxID=2844358 RepID=UPI001E2F1695|nr:tryptophan transporter [Radiobacillus kanasensis]UFU00490.1 tryptophan transporter [Radiobacillus kanasensis]
MNLQTRILSCLVIIVGLGAILHALVPPVLLGMRPDMMLAMMFLGIMLFPSLPYVFLLSVLTGLVSALTTTVPGGEIANLVDKPITALFFFGTYLVLTKKINVHIAAPILAACSTMISGAIFLFLSLFIVGIFEGSFFVLFMTIVVPTALFNTIFIVVLFPLTQRVLERLEAFPMKTEYKNGRFKA